MISEQPIHSASRSTQPRYSTAPLISAYTILGKMAQAARAVGDIGREFVSNGVRRLVGMEIENRRANALDAREIAAEVLTAEIIFEHSMADGVIDKSEATRIRAALRKPERHAGKLAASLAIPEALT